MGTDAGPWGICSAQTPRPSQLLSVSPGVYAFGFLFMLPQLFVNYKVRPRPSTRSPVSSCGLPLICHVSPVPQMKSVAHLPWKAFTYKVSAQPGASSGLTCPSGGTSRGRGAGPL